MAGPRTIGRLTREAEFRRVYQEGARRTASLVVVHALPNGRGAIRVGIVVGRRFGGAVERNRVRRRLREAVRSYQGRLIGGVDIVVVPRGSAARATYADLGASLAAALEAARLLAGAERDGNPP